MQVCRSILMKSFLQSIFSRKLAATFQVTILLDMEEHQPALKGKHSRCVKHPLPGSHAHNWSQIPQPADRRWSNTATGEQFAVKRLNVSQHIQFPHLMANEYNGLTLANNFETPRVVKLEGLIALPNGNGLVVLK